MSSNLFNANKVIEKSNNLSDYISFKVKPICGSNSFLVYLYFNFSLRILDYFMLKKFNQYFKDLIFDRTEEISQKILFSNKRYRKLPSQIIEVQHVLTDNLPLQLQPLVNRYDEPKPSKTVKQ
jgi:hypothetical protein